MNAPATLVRTVAIVQMLLMVTRVPVSLDMKDCRARQVYGLNLLTIFQASSIR